MRSGLAGMLKASVPRVMKALESSGKAYVSILDSRRMAPCLSTRSRSSSKSSSVLMAR